jgi:hypothetical protein
MAWLAVMGNTPQKFLAIWRNVVVFFSCREVVNILYCLVFMEEDESGHSACMYFFQAQSDLREYPLFSRKESKIMAFTEQDFAKQEQAIAGLLDEFLRLNSKLDALLKAQGVSEEFLKDGEVDNPPPELKAQLETAKAKAKRAGEERKSHAKLETAAPSGAAATSARRPGAIPL